MKSQEPEKEVPETGEQAKYSPAIGDIVLFYDGVTLSPAIITEVWSDTCANLMVFLDGIRNYDEVHRKGISCLPKTNAMLSGFNPLGKPIFS